VKATLVQTVPQSVETQAALGIAKGALAGVKVRAARMKSALVETNPQPVRVKV
jgi:hypothetical protein